MLRRFAAGSNGPNLELLPIGRITHAPHEHAGLRPAFQGEYWNRKRLYHEYTPTLALRKRTRVDTRMRIFRLAIPVAMSESPCGVLAPFPRVGYNVSL